MCQGFNMSKDDLRSSVDIMVLPMTRAMSWLGITPDMVTFANFAVKITREIAKIC